MDRQKIGKDAEQRAEEFLLKQRLTLLERNYSCRFGEIDLIMRQGNTVVFVEVRYRNTLKYGGAAASVTPSKQRKIVRTAELYLTQHKALSHKSCRFDVIAFEYDAAPDKPLWYKDAFRP